MSLFKMKLIFILLSVLVSQTVLGAYVFTAPPRESISNGKKVYKPIADFLTRTTGEHFVYKQQNTWDEYVSDMKKQKYDLVFDGPHFVDWRIHNIEHSAILKIPHLLQWRIIVRQDNTSITNIQDLVGKTACAPGSPNFGMLNMFNHFKEEDKQPVHVKVKGWNNVYEGVKSGKCVAGVLPKKNHLMYDSKEEYTRSIHTHLPYPNQAFTSGKRIPEGLRERIRKSLLTDEGQKALQNLRARYTNGAKLVSAEDEEFDSIHALLIKARNFSQVNTKGEISNLIVNK